MMLWEPAGCDHSGGKSAESVPRARGPDGDGANSSVTVCEAYVLHSCAICSHEIAFHDRWIRSPAIFIISKF